MRTRSSDVFLGRQPIVDRERRVAGYELLFRSSAGAAEARVSDDARATAQVVARAFHDIGIRTVVGNSRAFINLDAESLLSGMVEALPRDQVVLEILETVDIDEHIVRRCRTLKAKGYRLALDDFTRYSEAHEPLLEIIDVVKIDVLQLDDASLSRLVRRLKLWPAALLAEKVDTAQRLRRCLALGFDLYQGFFFGRPAVLGA
ncbi:MAG: EAL domain-containing protein [Betaproteobacteria bacterium]|nr:EAL domain-containing protein [Betaproteobacteria bacterium]